MSRRVPKTIHTKTAAVTTTGPNLGSGSGGVISSPVAGRYEILFDDESDPVPISWLWEFKTASGVTLGTSSQQNPRFTFPGPGSYTVVLTVVFGEDGSPKSTSKTVMVV
jgi:PKD repeat protein